jgi:hypothetical protein
MGAIDPGSGSTAVSREGDEMTDAVIFGFGCFATLICAAAVALLACASYLDGKPPE